MATEGRLWDYSIGIAQIDDEIIEKLNFRISPHSTINLLVSRSVIPNRHTYCSIGGIENQHDAILESFDTTEEIAFFSHSLTVNNLLFSNLVSLRLQKSWTCLFSLIFSIFEFFLSRIVIYTQNLQNTKKPSFPASLYQTNDPKSNLAICRRFPIGWLLDCAITGCKHLLHSQFIQLLSTVN